MIGLLLLVMAVPLAAGAVWTEARAITDPAERIDVVTDACATCWGSGEVVINPDAPSFAHEVAPCPNPECVNGEVEVRA